METKAWSELLDDEDEHSCLSSDTCVAELLRDAPTGCLYCRLSDLGEGDDE